VTVHTAVEQAPWTPVPDAVWIALRTFLEPYVGAAFEIPGDPVPKKRRVGQGNRAFTPKRTREAEKSVRQAFDNVMTGFGPEPDLTYGVLVEFTTAAGSKVDVDNCLKLVMDALNVKLWQDDIQVGATFARIVRGRGTPGTKVLLFAMADNGTPATKMCGCGTRFRAKARRCQACTKQTTVVNQLLALEAADPVADQLAAHRRRAFSYLTACMIGSNVSPSNAAIAAHLGVTEHRARSIIATLIRDGFLAREGRTRLRIIKPLGDAA
jgi:Holliday junction resolvase RusA-like endonuclease